MKNIRRFLSVFLLVAILIASCTVAFAASYKIKSGGANVYNRYGKKIDTIGGGTAVNGYFKTAKGHNVFVITNKKFHGQAGCVFAYSLSKNSKTKYGKIKKHCNLRSSPTTKQNNKIGELNKGTKVYFHKYYNGFCKVTTSGNKTGWVYFKYITAA